MIKKAIDKYKKRPISVKAALCYAICNMLQRGISSICTVLFTRLMTTADYGRFAVYQSWFSLLYMVATINMSGAAYDNILVKSKHKIEEEIMSLLIFSSAMTIVLMAVVTARADFFLSFFEQTKFSMAVMLIHFFAMPAIDYWSTHARFRYDYRKLIAVTLLLVFATPISGVVLVGLCEDKFSARVFSSAIVYIIVGFLLYARYLYTSKLKIHLKTCIYAFKISIPLLPHYLAVMLLNHLDRIMISRLVDDGKAGIYSFAYSVASIVTVFVSAVQVSFTPYIYRSLKERKAERIKKNATWIMMFVLMICLLVILVGPELIGVLGTKEYYEARWVIPPVTLSVFFSFLYLMISNVEFYLEKTYFAAFVSITASLCNFFLNDMFIPRFGYYAAGFTTLFCYILMAAEHSLFYVFLSRKVDGVFEIKKILWMSVAGVAVMFFCLVLYRFFIIRYFIIALLLLALVLFRGKVVNIYRQIKIK